MSNEKTDGNHAWFWYVIQNTCGFHLCFHWVSKLMPFFIGYQTYELLMSFRSLHSFPLPAKVKLNNYCMQGTGFSNTLHIIHSSYIVWLVIHSIQIILKSESVVFFKLLKYYSYVISTLIVIFIYLLTIASVRWRSYHSLHSENANSVY